MQFSLKTLMIFTLAVCLFCVFGIPITFLKQVLAVFLVMVIIHGDPDQRTFAIGMLVAFVYLIFQPVETSSLWLVGGLIPFISVASEATFTIVSMVACGFVAVWAKRRINQTNSPPVLPPVPPQQNDSM